MNVVVTGPLGLSILEDNVLVRRSVSTEVERLVASAPVFVAVFVAVIVESMVC
jgi:hypothetical protein